MPFSPATTRALDVLSRELWLVVDLDGSIVDADERAERCGFRVGMALRATALAGCEAKLDELLRRGAIESLAHWELAVLIGGKPVTLLCSAVPAPAGVAIVGSVLPQDYAESAAESARAMQAVVGLHRELAKHKVRLEESNRGVRALHSELEVQADSLRTAAEVKDRLISRVSHELRTPLHSILGLSRLLLDNADGEPAPEQRKQVQFIRGAAEDLSALVSDMLDLARLDAGNPPLRAEAFELQEFLSAMRGTMLPLVPEDGALELVFDDAPSVPLETDQGKLGQIVRNLIANAIKFTPQGHVRVTATADREELRVVVADSGIGIAPADHERVFKEFVQVESQLQRKHKGTGLGLPLARQLASVLGGTLELASELGTGSTFTLTVPLVHRDVDRFRQLENESRQLDTRKTPVLVVEDDRNAVFVYEQYLSSAGFQVLPARSTADARDILRRVTPSAILLDVMLEREDTWSFLAELKRDPATKDIPVLVCTVMNREQHARALGADEFWLKPVDQDKLIRKLDSLVTERGVTVLAIDDDPTARYLIQKLLIGTPYKLLEAGDGHTGVALAREHHPNVILLDFLLDTMTAFDVLDELKADPRTRGIPVIVVTSHALPLEDRQRLGKHTTAIISKENLSRELAIHRIRDALRGAGITSNPGAES